MYRNKIISIALTALVLGFSSPSYALNEETFNQKILKSWVHFAQLDYQDAIDELDSLENLNDRQKKIKILILLGMLRTAGYHSAYTAPERAVERLSRAINLKDDEAQVRRARARAYCKLKMFNKCDKDFNRAWELEPDKSKRNAADHLADYGSALQQGGNLEEAKKKWNSAAIWYGNIGDDDREALYIRLSN